MRTIVTGHGWTVWGHLRDLARPVVADGQPWSAAVEDPRVGTVRLSGLMSHVPGADGILVVVHGMGGDASRAYCVRAANAARRLGLSCLRLNLRGADGRGEDIYHIGLTDDLGAALASDSVARYRKIYALGFSLGGHIVLRHAVLGGEGLRAAAAVCAPLDLAAGVRHIDRRHLWPYRRHLLEGVKQVYLRAARRGRLPATDLRGIRTIRAWDEAVVAPRFGFDGADHYYQQVGVMNHLDRLAVPSLFAAAPADPMVPSAGLQPILARASERLTVRWLRGGHVGFPDEDRIIHSVVSWLVEQP